MICVSIYYRRVKVIRLVGRSTVEEIILKRAQAKLKLTNAVIEGGQFSVGVDKSSLIADSNTQVEYLHVDNMLHSPYIGDDI